MRKVSGEEITIKELKNLTFGFDWVDTLVDSIEVDGRIITINEEGNYYITFPINWEDCEFFADCCERDKPISVYEFINDYWGLDEYDLEDFTFYIDEI